MNHSFFRRVNKSEVIVFTSETEERPLLGDLITIADCGHWSIGAVRFKEACGCDFGCNGGERPVIREVRDIPASVIEAASALEAAEAACMPFLAAAEAARLALKRAEAEVQE